MTGNNKEGLDSLENEKKGSPEGPLCIYSRVSWLCSRPGFYHIGSALIQTLEPGEHT